MHEKGVPPSDFSLPKSHTSDLNLAPRQSICLCDRARRILHHGEHAKPAYSVNEFHEISESGVVGHPDLATAEKGRRFFDAIVGDTVAFVEDLLTW